MRLLYLLLVPLGQAALAQPAGVVPAAGVRPDAILFADSTTLTLALEGPAPLRVELPDETAGLLTAESAAVWRIRPAGPATVTPLPGGRERWEHAFRLDPYSLGDRVPVAFSPVRVTAGTDLNPQEVTFPTVAVKVELERWRIDSGKTVVPEVLEKARQEVEITGIETLPPVPPPDPSRVGWLVAGALGLIFTAVLAVAVVRKWRAKPPPVPPGEWAEGELARLEGDLAAGRATTADATDRLAIILREYVQRRYALPAPMLTTSELIAACERAEWQPASTAVLGEVLGRCDRSKFAGDFPDSAEGAGLLTLTRDWLRTTDAVVESASGAS